MAQFQSSEVKKYPNRPKTALINKTMANYRFYFLKNMETLIN